MDDAETTNAADSMVLWALTEHCCRRCFRRVLARTIDGGKQFARCDGDLATSATM